MELHTVSVNGAYTQADVTALSSILTGWTVDRPNQGGPFLFDQKRHEPGSKQWLGRSIPEGRDSDGAPAGMREGLAALSFLAASPKTAHFISFLLAQRFVADQPPDALVDRLTAVYMTTDGDIKQILRALIASPEFNERRYFRTKSKTPLEFVASCFRSTATDPINPGALVGTLKHMGMAPFYALPPTGYILTADHWINTGALVDRLNFTYQLTQGKFANQKFDSPRVLALGLMSATAWNEGIEPTTGTTSQLRPPMPAVLVSSKASARAAPGARELASDVGGSGLALLVLSRTLLGEDASPKSLELIRQQLSSIPQANSVESLNLMTALLLGSPEFQKR